MRQPIVIANWKMHGSKASISALLDGIKKAGPFIGAEVVILPPFVYLEQVANSLTDTDIAWGSQNVSHKSSGAFTGEISAQMLLDFNCRYALIGHSERRLYYGEEDAVVAKKFIAAKTAGLTPIICVGETTEQRDNGLTHDVIAKQVQAILDVDSNKEGLHKVIFAYEPVWAIGTGVTPMAEQIQEVHAAIRKQITRFDVQMARNVRIIYGGSVKASNAKQFFAMPDVDGSLVGGASLDSQEFIYICNALNVAEEG